MGYNQKAKFIKNSPLPCWKGYERVPGTARGAKGSCRKSSPAKLDLTKKSGFFSRKSRTCSFLIFFLIIIHNNISLNILNNILIKNFVIIFI